MSTSSDPQRRWQALCPGCGAPVEFASAASASAVCGFCRSTLLREGDALRRIGVVAELFDDHSPLQLGASGRHQGVGFTLVGRQQFRYAQGTWSEWHLLFDASDGGAGKSAWLSEDNGAYVLSFERTAPSPAPTPTDLRVGARTLISGDAWRVASLQKTSLIAAEGELPRAPALSGEFWVADLRQDKGEVGTLEWSTPAAPVWSVGRRVALGDLALRGLKEGASEAALQGRTLPCPSCGATLSLTLATTRSVVCGQCKSVVDVSAGAGAELAHYAQNNAGHDGRLPDIALGRSGRLAIGTEPPQDWQVVGFQERCSVGTDEDGDDESVFWREYLLYNRIAGFAFLVDAGDGMSVVRPITGAPEERGSEVVWEGRRYRPREAEYTATTTWVLGEFYWTVQRGERLRVTDYAEVGGNGVLSAERSDSELVWSAGRRLSYEEFRAAFPPPQQPAGQARTEPAPDPLRFKDEPGIFSRVSQGFIILLVVILVMALMSRCDGSDKACDPQRQAFGEASAEYQQCLRNQRSSGGFGSGGGGSFGGFSSGGGGHK